MIGTKYYSCILQSGYGTIRISYDARSISIGIEIEVIPAFFFLEFIRKFRICSVKFSLKSLRIVFKLWSVMCTYIHAEKCSICPCFLIHEWQFTSVNEMSYAFVFPRTPSMTHLAGVVLHLWNAKLTETRIFRELSIEIESSLIELKSSLILLKSSLIQLESSLIQLESSLIQLLSSLYMYN